MSTISLITPFFNEAETLPLYRGRIEAEMLKLGLDYEIVLVDDHSSDTSPEFAAAWAATDPRVKYIRLSRNCGAHTAYTAGLKECIGHCATLLAADLQDPPETIKALYEKWQAGSDVVWATRMQRDSSGWSSDLLGTLYYQMMRRIALPETPANGVGFFLIDRKVIDVYNLIPEKNTSIFSMVLWMGFKQEFVEFVPARRPAGSTKWSTASKVKLFVDSLVSFSYFPIRFMSCCGGLMALAGFVYAFVVIVGRLAGWILAGTGFATLMTVLLVGQGMIMLMLGVLGEYIWRTFDEARQRPRYMIETRFPQPKTAQN